MDRFAVLLVTNWTHLHAKSRSLRCSNALRELLGLLISGLNLGLEHTFIILVV